MDVDTFPLKQGSVVMVYGYKGIVRYIGESEYIHRAGESKPRQIIGVEFSTKCKFSQNPALVPKSVANVENIRFVDKASVLPYSANEAAAIRLQAFFRTVFCKLRYIREMSFQFWNHMESLQEYRTLENKRDVYLPIIDFIKKKYEAQGINRPPGTRTKRRFSDQIADLEVKSYPEVPYDGPKIGATITTKVANEFLDAYKSGQMIEFPIHYVQRILLDMLSWYRKNDKGVINYVDIPKHENSNLIIVGDLHGQLNDLLWIFYKFGAPSSRNVYIFNGDIADRGPCATNIFLLLFCFKLADPDSVIINRGNHESEDMNESYGFAREVRSKYDGHIYNLFQRIFWELPLAIVVEKRIIVVHGGLFRHDGVTLDAISKIDRKRMCPASPDTFENSIIFDMLWSDPQKHCGRDVSARGVDCIKFGPDVTNSFLDLNNLDICIRSHQVPSSLKGIESNHSGRCITLFSASNYCQTTGNTGAILIFSKGLHFEVMEYMAPSLDVIHTLANNTNQVTDKILDAAACHQLEMEQRTIKKHSSERLMEDILLKISEIVCLKKQQIWRACYNYDVSKNGTISPKLWTEALTEIVEVNIPRIFSIKLLQALNPETQMVHYNDILKRFTIGFDPVGYEHKNLQRECIAYIFECMIKADLSLREILMLFDRNLDGLVSFSELDETIRKLDIGLSNPQVKILMRTILNSCIHKEDDPSGKADIVEFLSKLKVIYSASVRYDIKDQWIEDAIPALGRVILSDRKEAAARYYDLGEEGQAAKNAAIEEVRRKRSSAIRAVALFQKFQEYDKVGCGLLSYSDFVEALKHLDLSKAEQELGFHLTDAHLMEIAHVIDVAGTSKINYLDFLQAFYVVDNNKYSIVNEMWDHICSTLYRHRSSIRHALNAYNSDDGTVHVEEFKEVLMALYEILGFNEAPFTFEQTEVLVDCIDTNAQGMILYNEFLDSFKPIYA
ncbi:bifunctional Metallo-dependent phosphatase-like/EF-hand domain pair/Serine-threonine-specific protein phosphatase-bis(5-nucleosyl)-tetraphosphatase/EF-hand domain/Calcineurin-like phosphoesterase domain [Babesia duncani]|uniref:Serine/threonine-protein phosphatase n=1 Tax=Babesia duncani TaxID=323732 RepID=A0AAD9PMC0_9APIC|nr:bifunctional Metallo-dependent phosphatase-like/EF-hand domain pair/Serine-threonine-specific protein phosphatase-bis(5-nucleosyl)-tetraphosphatase/EF-hand domain/Calcineurin-like phosphoesterase domain [Babesia duncani]